jgi:hypothetical protein
MAYVLLELKLGGGPWIGCTRADEIERRRLGSSGDRIGRLGSRSSGGQRWSVVCDDWQREGARGYNPWTAFTTTSGPQQRHQASTTFGAPRAPPPAGGGCDGGGGCGRGGGSGSGGSSTSSGNQGKGNPSWPSFYNPWTDTINMWPGPSMGASPSRPP